MSHSDWQQAGKQRFRIDGDVQWLQLTGTVEESEIQTITSAGKALTEQIGYYIVLCDSTQGTGMSPQARRFNASFNDANHALLGVSIVYGANPAARLMLSMITRGMALLARKAPQVLFAKDEADAVLLAATERVRLRAEASHRQAL